MIKYEFSDQKNNKIINDSNVSNGTLKIKGNLQIKDYMR